MASEFNQRVVKILEKQNENQDKLSKEMKATNAKSAAQRAKLLGISTRRLKYREGEQKNIDAQKEILDKMAEAIKESGGVAEDSAKYQKIQAKIDTRQERLEKRTRTSPSAKKAKDKKEDSSTSYLKSIATGIMGLGKSLMRPIGKARDSIFMVLKRLFQGGLLIGALILIDKLLTDENWNKLIDAIKKVIVWVGEKLPAILWGEGGTITKPTGGILGMFLDIFTFISDHIKWQADTLSDPSAPWWKKAMIIIGDAFLAGLVLFPDAMASGAGSLFGVMGGMFLMKFIPGGLAALFTPIGLIVAAAFAAFYASIKFAQKNKKRMEDEKKAYGKGDWVIDIISNILASPVNAVKWAMAEILKAFGKDELAKAQAKVNYSILIGDFYRDLVKLTQNIVDWFTLGLRKIFFGKTKEDLLKDLETEDSKEREQQDKLEHILGTIKKVKEVKKGEIIPQEIYADYLEYLKRYSSEDIKRMEKRLIFLKGQEKVSVKKKEEIEKMKEGETVGGWSNDFKKVLQMLMLQYGNLRSGYYRGGLIPQGKMASVAELGPELIMKPSMIIPKSDVQVYSANRTEQMLDQALNKMFYGGGADGGGTTNTIISPVNNIANNTTAVSSPISIADVDPVLNRVTSYAI